MSEGRICAWGASALVREHIGLDEQQIVKPVGWVKQVWRGDLRIRLMVGQTVVIVAIMIVGCVTAIYYQNHALQEGVKERALALARTFSAFGAVAVQDNLYQLQESMQALQKDEDLLNLDIVDEDRMISAALHPHRIGTTLLNESQAVASSNFHTESILILGDILGRRTLLIVEPLQFKTGEWMFVHLEYSLTRVDQIVQRMMWGMIWVTFLLVLVGVLAVSRGVNRMSEVLHSMTKEFNVPLQCRNGTQSELAYGQIEQLSLAIREANRLLVAQQQELRTQADLLERKVEERTSELAEARDRALDAAKLKAEFLATMSHEIRTPMNGVIGMTGLLLDTSLSPEQREFAETVRRSGDALLTIINDILDFSKIEAGRLSLEIIPFDLRTLVEDTLELLAEPAHRKHLELIGLIAASVPSSVRGDPGRVRQILTNLVANAIKFTETGEVSVKVTAAKTTDSTAEIRFEVIDTGIGISKEAQGRLFQSFSQADGSTTRKYGGTGLGLAICKQLAGLMQGQIGIESTPGKGSCFWFTVRLEIDTSSPAILKANQVDRLTGMKVCIVDDNATNCTLLEHYAKDWGLRQVTAYNGPDALATMRTAKQNGEPFDLALLDMQMPEMDGMELARHIKADPALASIRLVMLTSLGGRGEAKLAHETGLAGYLTKPIRQGQLFDCLRLVMGDTTHDKNANSANLATLVTKHSLSEIAASKHGRLLVAEDNPVNQKVAVKMLEKLGYKVDVVSNGKEAVEAVQRQPYVVVLMDCQMPEMDGLEATRAIRVWEQTHAPCHSTRTQDEPHTDSHSAQHRHIPIIAMTANAMEEDRQRCLAAGMDDFVSKPISRTTVTEVLARWYRDEPLNQAA